VFVALCQETLGKVVQEPGGLGGSPHRAVDADAELLEQLAGHHILMVDYSAEDEFDAAVTSARWQLLASTAGAWLRNISLFVAATFGCIYVALTHVGVLLLVAATFSCFLDALIVVVVVVHLVESVSDSFQCLNLEH
jgi:hypothetical protein